MKHSSTGTQPSARIWMLGACVAAAVGVVTPLTSAQEGAAPAKKVRLSKLIHALEQGRPAIMGEDWTFFDAEHSPYDISDLARRIAANVNDRDAEGRPKITPLVRPPGDGDSDTRWMVKQLLDNGAFGIVFPHIDTKEQALKAVQSMRYPPLRNQKIIEPLGTRGHGPRNTWGLERQEYVMRADLWPLNPEGELFAMMMIDSALGAKNVREIMQVPGVGAVIMIPDDLALSYGLMPKWPRTVPGVTQVLNYPEVTAAWQAALKGCRELKKICGVVDAVERNRKKRIEEGFRIVG